MKNFVSLRIATLVLVAGYMLKTTSADADVTVLGVAAGDATTNDVIVWTRAKDEANPQPTAINVQISQDPTLFMSGQPSGCIAWLGLYLLGKLCRNNIDLLDEWRLRKKL